MKRHAQFQPLLASFSKGEVAASGLPLEDEEFWLWLFAQAAHPGRFNRSSQAAAAAERLLHRPLDAGAARARHSAAIGSLATSDRDTRRHAIRFLHEAAPNTQTLDAAARAVHDSDTEVGVEAVRLLTKHTTPQTLPALLDVLATAFDLRETLAAEALVELDGAAIPGLTTLLEHDDPASVGAQRAA